jgi:hypothetical protein
MSHTSGRRSRSTPRSPFGTFDRSACCRTSWASIWASMNRGVSLIRRRSQNTARAGIAPSASEIRQT